MLKSGKSMRFLVHSKSPLLYVFTILFLLMSVTRVWRVAQRTWGGAAQGGSKNYFWKGLKYPVEKAGKIQKPVPILSELAIVPQLWWYHYQIPIDIDTHIKSQWTFIQLFTLCNLLSQKAVAFLYSFKVKQFESIETQMRSQISK